LPAKRVRNARPLRDEGNTNAPFRPREPGKPHPAGRRDLGGEAAERLPEGWIREPSSLLGSDGISGWFLSDCTFGVGEHKKWEEPSFATSGAGRPVRIAASRQAGLPLRAAPQSPGGAVEKLRRSILETRQRARRAVPRPGPGNGYLLRARVRFRRHGMPACPEGSRRYAAPSWIAAIKGRRAAAPRCTTGAPAEREGRTGLGRPARLRLAGAMPAGKEKKKRTAASFQQTPARWDRLWCTIGMSAAREGAGGTFEPEASASGGPGCDLRGEEVTGRGRPATVRKARGERPLKEAGRFQLGGAVSAEQSTRNGCADPRTER